MQILNLFQLLFVIDFLSLFPLIKWASPLHLFQTTGHKSSNILFLYTSKIVQYLKKKKKLRTNSVNPSWGKTLVFR